MAAAAVAAVAAGAAAGATVVAAAGNALRAPDSNRAMRAALKGQLACALGGGCADQPKVDSVAPTVATRVIGGLDEKGT